MFNVYLSGTLAMNHRPYLHLFFTLFCYLFLIACKPKNSKINRAFYYWKSTFELQSSELNIIEQNKINTLYIKYFDVVWNDKLNQPLPVAKIIFKQAVPQQIRVVPVVYITNKVMSNLQKDEVQKLSKAIATLIDSYHINTTKKCKEIQIDCDWNLSTKDKYFELLNQLKKHYNAAIEISATIRLHQIKYAATTGVPPVSKGMLMYYNMGNLQNTNHNSIFNETDAEKYAPYIKQYPLYLDAVLPVFTWVKVIRNNKVIKLLNQTNLMDLGKLRHFKSINTNTLQATNVGHFQSFYFLPNDLFVEEKIDPKLSKKAAEHLHQYFNPANFTLSLFHLHQANLNEYSFQNIEDLYTTFN